MTNWHRCFRCGVVAERPDLVGIDEYLLCESCVRLFHNQFVVGGPVGSTDLYEHVGVGAHSDG